MSYIGRKPIKILSDTHVELNDNDVIIQGPLGSLQYPQVEGIDITSLEIRDTIHSTYTKYYVDPNDDGNHQEIYKPDPHADGYVLPVE